MKITFLGTKGYIAIKSRAHYRHTITMLEYSGHKVLIDCGIDWLGRIDSIKPDAIILTHAHPDHAWGLQNGCQCPVYATQESHEIIKKYPLRDRINIIPRVPITLFGAIFKAFNVEHSLKAPAVGYRITYNNRSIFCVHDLVYIHEQQEALSGVELYVGDGATIKRPLIRKRDDHLIGHSPIATQLAWCKKFNIPRAYFTHCGTEIVSKDGRVARGYIHQLGKEKHVDARIACDGKVVEI